MTIGRAWAYATRGGRDGRLDLLRGFCVFVMVVDHVGGGDSPLFLITGGNTFYVSAAEGFLLISGITMGLVYSRIASSRGLRAMAAKVLSRAAYLYAMTVALTLALAGVSAAVGDWWTERSTAASVEQLIVDVVTLHRAYPLADILFLYTFATALALPALIAARWRLGALAVLAASWAVWAASQGWWPGVTVDIPWHVEDSPFQYAPWQAIFHTGIVLGARASDLSALASRVPSLLRRAGAAVAVAGAVVAFAYLLALRSSSPEAIAVGAAVFPIGDVFEKSAVRSGRLVALAVVAVVAWTAVSLLWVPLRRTVGRLLVPLGQRSFGAYAVHVFVVAAVWSTAAEALRETGEWAALQLAAVAAVALALLVDVPRSARALASIAAAWRRATAPGLPLPFRLAPAGLALAVALSVSASGTPPGRDPAVVGAAYPLEAGPLPETAVEPLATAEPQAAEQATVALAKPPAPARRPRAVLRVYPNGAPMLAPAPSPGASLPPSL